MLNRVRVTKGTQGYYVHIKDAQVTGVYLAGDYLEVTDKLSTPEKEDFLQRALRSQLSKEGQL